MLISSNVQSVINNINELCKKINRDPNEIEIVGVTKYTDAQGIKDLTSAGIKIIGENKAQDAILKMQQFTEHELSYMDWHFIGHLQTNKVKAILPHFNMIHSLDRESLAKEINKQAEKLNIDVNCLIQVNIAQEDTKFGLSEDEVMSFCEKMRHYPRVKVKGLMTMAPFIDDDQEIKLVFRGLKKLANEIKEKKLSHIEMKHLSMGMSADYMLAIEEGATLVRLGSILFK